MKAERTFYAWGVRLRMEGKPLAGRYYFGPDIPTVNAGCVVALFETRRAAREAAASEGRCYRRPVRVRVTIEEVA